MKVRFLTRNRQNQVGFTLIELLIVIVIIGILSGVLLSVINPIKQQQKANETVMRSNLDKIRMAFLACVNTTTDPYNKCISNVATNNWDDPSWHDANDWTKLGVNDPYGEPKPNSNYTVVAHTNGHIYIVGWLDNNDMSKCGWTYRYVISEGNFAYGWKCGDCVIDDPLELGDWH